MPTSFNDPKYWRARAQENAGLGCPGRDLDIRALCSRLPTNTKSLRGVLRNAPMVSQISGPPLLHIPSHSRKSWRGAIVMEYFEILVAALSFCGLLVVIGLAFGIHRGREA
jgi:hypothetical protein